MLFGQSSEKKRHKPENQIRQAEKRLSELENRLNTARNLLEDASSVTDSPDTSPPSENPIASKAESPGRKSSRKPLPAETLVITVKYICQHRTYRGVFSPAFRAPR